MAGRMLPYLTTAYLLVTLTHGQNPAIKVILTDKGLQYVKETGAEWLRETLENAPLPGVYGEYSLGILGTVYYSLVGITVSGCDFPEPSVEFYEDVSGFKASISGLGVAVTGSWSTAYGIIKDTGTFSLEVLDVVVVSAVRLEVGADGQPSVRWAACEATVGSASVHFHGGSSWIFDPFVDDSRIRRIIEEKICPAVREHLDALDYRLQGIGATFQVTQLLAVDVPLTSAPVVTSSSLSLSLKGLFHTLKSQEDPPFEAQPFSLAGEPGHMLSLGLSEYTLNSAAFAYFTSGQLQALITDNMIPPGSPFRLDTSSFGPFIPELPKMYPGMEMMLQVYAMEAPEFLFRPGAVKTDLLGAIKAFTVKADRALIPLFTLNVESTFTGKFRMATEKLTGSVAMNNFTVTLVVSEVGTFKTGALETAMKFGMLSGLSTLNAKLAKGIDLPKMQQAQLTNLVLKIEEGFISVFSDAKIWLMRDSNVGTHGWSDRSVFGLFQLLL